MFENFLVQVPTQQIAAGGLDDYADDEGIVLGLESCCRVS
jgi:hypothetical protein